MSKEVWRDIKGYEGLYQVSNMGRIKSLERLVKARGGSYRPVKERILKGGYDNNGYKIVSLAQNSKNKTRTIHQLVVSAFLNHIPNGHKDIVDHINGIKDDNELNNLRIVTVRQNSTTCFRKDKNNFTSKYPGVGWHKQHNKWWASIEIKGKTIHLGYFIKEIDANNAYETALLNKDNPQYFKSIKRKTTSEYKGVSWHKSSQRWRALISIDGKQVHIGSFIKEYDAHLAYQKALREK